MPIAFNSLAAAYDWLLPEIGSVIEVHPVRPARANYGYPMRWVAGTVAAAFFGGSGPEDQRIEVHFGGSCDYCNGSTDYFCGSHCAG